VNEASHKSIDYHIATCTRDATLNEEDTFDILVQEAVLIHNSVPHVSTGEAPAMLLMGVDLVLPGWRQFQERETDELRLLRLKDRRIRKTCRLTMRRQFPLKETIEEGPGHHFEVNDIVVYRLSDVQMNKEIQHISGCGKYMPKWSLPCRVLKVAPFNVIVKPLWMKGKEIRRPTSQVRLVASRVPSSLRGTVGQIITAGAPEMAEPVFTMERNVGHEQTAEVLVVRPEGVWERTRDVSMAAKPESVHEEKEELNETGMVISEFINGNINILLGALAGSKEMLGEPSKEEGSHT
jgi:hypothetical protein